MVLLIHLRVADYNKWKPVFNERQASRAEHGGTRHWLYRAAEDPNELMVSIEFPNAQAARSYVDDTGLRAAIGRAGVAGEPHFHFLEEVEAVRY